MSGAPPAASATDVVGTVVAAFRQEWGRITAALIHQTGDWDLAVECAQDAFTQAMRRWPRDAVPNRPGPWLMTVARNGAIDRWAEVKIAAHLNQARWAVPARGPRASDPWAIQGAEYAGNVLTNRLGTYNARRRCAAKTACRTDDLRAWAPESAHKPPRK